MKGKPLLPTLRTKKRYVVYETISENDLNNKQVFNVIQDSYKECYGVFGLGEAGIMDTKIYHKNKAILKINHKYLDKLRTAMAMITNINDNDVIVNTVSVSGMIKKAKIRLNRRVE